MKSLTDRGTPCQNSAGYSGDETASSPSLDIYRDFRTSQLTAGSILDKNTPARVYTKEEKAAYVAALDAAALARSHTARAIASSYVNSPEITDDEKDRRLSVFGSFLRCSAARPDNAPMELYLDNKGKIAPAGEWCCSSRWACPRCSSRLLYKDAQKLKRALVAASRLGLSVLFLTLTVPHVPGDDLRWLMTSESSAFSDSLHSRVIREMKKRYSLVGTVRAFDLTCSLRSSLDFHPHFHVLMFFDDEIRDDDFDALEYFLYTAWSHEIKKKMGRNTSRAAFKLERVSLGPDKSRELSSEAVADYAAKLAVLPSYITKSRPDGVNLGAGGLSPLDFLDRYAAGLDTELMAAAWTQYVDGTKGLHRIHASKGLYRRLGVLEEKRPETVARFLLPPRVAALTDTRPGLFRSILKCLSDNDAAGLAGLLEKAGCPPSELAGCLADCLERLPVYEDNTSELRAHLAASRPDLPVFD